MIRLCLISATDPTRSAVIAALEGNEFETVRVSVDADLHEVLAYRPEILLFEATEGLPVVPAVRRVLNHPQLSSVLLLLLIDAGRLSLLERVPGVADFVVTPFAGHELRTRIRRLLARQGQKKESPEIVAGDLLISVEAYEVHLAGQVLQFTHQEFELLRFLVSHKGRVFSREQLLNEVWGYDYYGGPRTVDVHIRRIRSKLSGRYAQAIVTVRNVGYKFIVPSD